MGGKKKTPSHKTPENKKRRREVKKDETPSEKNESSSSAESEAESDGEPTNAQIIAEVRASQKFISKKFEKFSKAVEELTLANASIKKDVQGLQTTTSQQHHQISDLTVELQDVKQQLLQKDLVVSGLPNLTNISPDTILAKTAEIYGFDPNEIVSKEIISGKNKTSKNPFQMIFLSMRSVESKQLILDKQKTAGPIVWDQLAENVPENIKTNKIRFNNRLTQYKQSILNEGKKFSKENKTNVPFVWEKNGKILLKETNVDRPLVLNTLADLELIKIKYKPVT